MIAVLYMGGSGGDLVASLLNSNASSWKMPEISPRGRIVRSYQGWQEQGFDLNDATQQLERLDRYTLPACPMLMHRHFKTQDLDTIAGFTTVDISVNSCDLDLVADICIDKHNDSAWHPNGDQGWLENHNIFGAFYRTDRDQYQVLARDFWKSWYWHSRMNIDYVKPKITIPFRDLFRTDFVNTLARDFDVDRDLATELHSQWKILNDHYIR